MNLNKAPRNARNAESPGHYHVIPKLSSDTVNPGEQLRFEVMISGYGDIRNSKINLYFPQNIFDNDNSTVKSGLVNKSTDNRPLLSFDSEATPLKSEEGFSLSFKGILIGEWKIQEETIFFDVNNQPVPMIATETTLNSAPIEAVFVIANKARPGTYNMTLNFTYFNGIEWKGDRISIPIKITSLYERQEGPILWSAFAFGVITTVISIIDLISKMN
jgi:hypothetical protein